ncbi:MlaD family protein [Ferruginibacter lapsinanis]|uniref:MlaD family protein n=1 Tax=Ferruginibacter lapsinanis TaxID=563172 RepID=UPI001E2C1AD1|nr:MlaD family protein [Ferruginibacter lapsinanis]UEG49582.1 MlaD family protein [Ferruginibacter lapsinanis]
MTISNETKVGALTSIAIVLLILGFNFLKGKSFKSNKVKYYAVFDNIQGLANSNPVMINGKQVGTVFNTDGGMDMRKIKVTMNMSIPVNIPDNSVAVVTTSLLGTTSLEIKLGNATKYYTNGDTIATEASSGMFDVALQKVDPVLAQVKIAVKSLDSLLGSVNSLFDPNTKNNIKGTLENLNKTTANLTVSSAYLQTLLNTQSGALAKTLNNVSSFTGALASNNDKMNDIMTNVEKTTANFSKLDVEKTLASLNGTINELKNTVGKINSDNGTLGLLLNDKKLYTNLNATSNKLNLLLDDVRLHPKRYINISVFGKKDKETPLMVPLPDTVNAPYLNK